MSRKRKKHKIVIEYIGGKLYAGIRGPALVYLPSELILQAAALIEEKNYGPCPACLAIDESKLIFDDEPIEKDKT